MVSSKARIGIDFDNTIVIYDSVFHKMALARKWIHPDTPSDKKSIRSAIESSWGKDHWIQLQGVVYSEGMNEAHIADGFADFMEWTRRSRIEAYIISHKTEFAAGDRSIHLRKPARDWLERRGFFDPKGFGFDAQREVFFEETLGEKLNRIRACGCTHFIDDHTEVLMNKEFPRRTKPIFYNTTNKTNPSADLMQVKDWPELLRYFRGDDAIDQN